MIAITPHSKRNNLSPKRNCRERRFKAMWSAALKPPSRTSHSGDGPRALSTCRSARPARVAALAGRQQHPASCNDRPGLGDWIISREALPFASLVHSGQYPVHVGEGLAA